MMSKSNSSINTPDHMQCLKLRNDVRNKASSIDQYHHSMLDNIKIKKSLNHSSIKTYSKLLCMNVLVYPVLN